MDVLSASTGRNMWFSRERLNAVLLSAITPRGSTNLGANEDTRSLVDDTLNKECNRNRFKSTVVRSSLASTAGNANVTLMEKMLVSFESRLKSVAFNVWINDIASGDIFRPDMMRTATMAAMHWNRSQSTQRNVDSAVGVNVKTKSIDHLKVHSCHCHHQKMESIVFVVYESGSKFPQKEANVTAAGADNKQLDYDRYRPKVRVAS